MSAHGDFLAKTLVVGIPVTLACMAFPPLLVVVIPLVWAIGRILDRSSQGGSR